MSVNQPIPPTPKGMGFLGYIVVIWSESSSITFVVASSVFI